MPAATVVHARSATQSRVVDSASGLLPLLGVAPAPAELDQHARRRTRSPRSAKRAVLDRQLVGAELRMRRQLVGLAACSCRS